MSKDKGKISDGYHTFDELYEHRHMLFIALLNIHAINKILAWKSRKHSDGTDSYPGWFIAGMELPTGQITYHLPDRLWDLCQVTELDVAPPFDGHTSDDVINRLKEWINA